MRFAVDLAFDAMRAHAATPSLISIPNSVATVRRVTVRTMRGGTRCCPQVGDRLDVLGHDACDLCSELRIHGLAAQAVLRAVQPCGNGGGCTYGQACLMAYLPVHLDDQSHAGQWAVLRGCAQETRIDPLGARSLQRNTNFKEYLIGSMAVA
jgi:hypothetical protein